MNAPLPAGVATQSLRRHLEALQAAGRLERFDQAADVDHDVSAVSYRTYVDHRKACHFTNLTGFAGWEVASQLVMDRAMWALALGVREEEVVDTFARRLAMPVAPELVGSGPVQELIETGDAVDLMKIPAIWTSERDP